MVKNFGGNKTKSKSRKSVKRNKIYNSEELKKIDGQEYAYVNKKLGDGRFELICYDKVKRLGILRGTLRKTAKTEKGHMVLVSKRDYQDEKCDIIECYTADQVEQLISFKEIVRSFATEGVLRDDSFSNLSNIISYNDDDDEDDEIILDENENDNDNNSDDIGIDINDI